MIRTENMTNFDVVKKLIGDINPKGDSSRDGVILDNIKAMCELHREIQESLREMIEYHIDDHQHSIKQCVNYILEHLNNINNE